MKTQILSLISMLASCTFARPRARPFAANDPVTQQSRVTAFVLTDEGVSVECWEISNLLPESTPQYNRRHGPKGPSVMRIYNDELIGVDILTWPEPEPLWPPPGYNTHSKSSQLSFSDSLFSINTGLVNFRVNSGISNTDDDEDDGNYIFSHENGDNWFYFEDQTNDDDESTQQCANARSDAPPLTISTRSATDTTLIQFKYDTTPTHTVLHPGRCRFAGLVNEESNNRREFAVQEW